MGRGWCFGWILLLAASPLAAGEQWICRTDTRDIKGDTELNLHDQGIAEVLIVADSCHEFWGKRQCDPRYEQFVRGGQPLDEYANRWSEADGQRVVVIPLFSWEFVLTPEATPGRWAGRVNELGKDIGSVKCKPRL